MPRHNNIHTSDVIQCSCNTDKSFSRLASVKLQKAMGIDYGPQSQITELNRLQQPADRISSLDRNELRGESCGISHPTNGGMTRGCPRCCAKPFKTRSDIVCPITEASAADRKMLPDLSHTDTHTQTHCSEFKCFQ